MLIRFSPLSLNEFPNPRPPAQRKTSAFKAPWLRTLELLKRELQWLGARDVTIRAGFPSAGLRLDGWPRGGLVPEHPAVILAFTDVDGKMLSFPCDRYLTYTENIRAIALSLEALRAVDRFGVTRGHEQYSGFKQIEAARDANQWTLEDAAQFLGIKSGTDARAILADGPVYRAAYRQCARLMHPDRGGNIHEWHALEQARILLDSHHLAAQVSGVL